MLLSSKMLRIVVSVLLLISMVVITAGCGLLSGDGNGNGNGDGNGNGNGNGDGDGNGDGNGNGTEKSFVSLSDFKALAKLDVYRSTYVFDHEEDSGDALSAEMYFYFDGHEDIYGKKTNKIVVSVITDDDDEHITMWITDDGNVAKVDFGDYVLEGDDAQDWAEYEWPETQAPLASTLSNMFYVDKLGEETSGSGWKVKSTSSGSQSISGQSITVVTYEVVYSPPLMDETIIVEWKIASFPGYKILAGLSAPGMTYTLKEISFR